MRRTFIATTAALLALAVAGVAGFSSSSASRPHTHSMHAAQAPQAASARITAGDLRVTLDRLLGEHALLAISATQQGLKARGEFPAIARALDRNSVELANVIGAAYGKAARNQFLNGRFMWRAHIRFFVNYTVALAQKNRAAQQRAVGNLRAYIEAFSGFLSRATGLPQSALRKSITEHVMQLKGQLDAYNAGNYRRSYALTRSAYSHMFMTGDVLAAAIAKQFPRKFPRS